MSTRSSSFDPASVSRGTWVAAVGALVLLISVFLSWYKASVSIITVTQSGWDNSGLAKLVALLALIALAVIAIELFASNVTLPFPSSLILIGIGALSFLIVLIKLFDKPDGADLA